MLNLRDNIKATVTHKLQHVAEQPIEDMYYGTNKYFVQYSIECIAAINTVAGSSGIDAALATPYVQGINIYYPVHVTLPYAQHSPLLPTY